MKHAFPRVIATSLSDSTRSFCGYALDLTGFAPAARVGFTHHLGIRNRAHNHADVGLLVAFDSRFLGAAIGLAPGELQFGTVFDVVIDDSERKHAPLVVAVA